MHNPSKNRRLRVAWAVALAMAAAMAGDAPVQAQDRYPVLIAPLRAMEGADAKFGREVAKELRDLMDDLTTHRSVEEKVFKDALKQYGVKEEDLADCVKARQFAILLRIDLVICGEYARAGNENQVTAKVVLPVQGLEFPFEPFTAREDKQAAQTMIAGFDQINQSLRLAQFCADKLNQEAWSEALTTCNDALQANPRSTTALYGMASAHDKLGQPAEAMPYLQRVLEIDAQHEEALLYAGVIASKAGDQSGAAQYFNRYLALNPGNVDVRLAVATDANNSGNPEVALQITEEAIPNSDDIRLREYAGHFALAAAQKKEEAADANGNAAEATQLYDKAIGYYEEVFQAKGDSISSTVLRNMLASYRKLERTQEALDFGQRAVAAHSDDAPLLSAYADVLNQAGRRAEAMAMLDRVVQVDPSYANISARKGSWLLEDGDLAGARAAFQDAISKGEIEADAAARQIIGTGFNKFGRGGQHQAAIPYYEAGKALAQSAETRAMGNFFHGYSLYQMADPIAKAQTRESAQRTLPMFRQVVQLMQGATAYTEQTRSINEILNAANRQIEIAELILKQGG